MSYQPQPQAQESSGGRGLTATGVVLFILGLLAGAALFFIAGKTEEDTVKKFARAPVGCTTTLQFDRADTYEVYLETSGQLKNASGDCVSNGTYNRADDDRPLVSLSLLGPNNTEVPMSPGTGASYDVGGFSGQAVQQVTIPATGSYQLTVVSDANDFVIAIGGESDADSEMLELAAIGAAIAGVVVGFVLLIAGNRSRRTPTPVAAPLMYPPAAPGPGWGAPQP